MKKIIYAVGIFSFYCLNVQAGHVDWKDAPPLSTQNELIPTLIINKELKTPEEIWLAHDFLVNQGKQQFTLKNLVHARLMFLMAAKSGHPEACCLYATMLIAGDGGEKDGPSAIKFLEQAIMGKSDCHDAYYLLASVYKHGMDGIEPDQEKSVHYLMQASEKGSAPASRQIAQEHFNLYQSSKLPEDLCEATKFLKRAGLQGDIQAKANFAELVSLGIVREIE